MRVCVCISHLLDPFLFSLLFFLFSTSDSNGWPNSETTVKSKV